MKTRKWLRRIVVGLGSLVVLYFVAALVLTFWPEPEFTTDPEIACARVIETIPSHRRFRPHLAGRVRWLSLISRMTRGQRGSLFLRCGAPSSPTLCRFIPALSGCPSSPLLSSSPLRGLPRL